MDDLIRYIGVAACLGLLAGCVCRIGLMQSKRDKRSWFLIYASLAVFGLGQGLDLLYGFRVNWYSMAGVLGLLLFLAITRKQWKHGPPPEVNSRPGGLRRMDGGEG